MNALAEGEILAMWERGQECEAPGLGVVLLSSALPEIDRGQLASWPVGQRDSRLLELRKKTFGGRMSASAACPGCGYRSRFVVEIDDILEMAKPVREEGPHELIVGSFELRYRLLDSYDLARAAALEDPLLARLELLRRSVVKARSDGREVSYRELPEPVIQALSDALETRDPMAVVPLNLACDRCQGSWLPLLDVVDFFWRELSARAEALLADVQTLALTYGWGEKEILSISPRRRRFYLENPPARTVVEEQPR